jgi:hypothetical protein
MIIVQAINKAKGILAKELELKAALTQEAILEVETALVGETKIQETLHKDLLLLMEKIGLVS